MLTAAIERRPTVTVLDAFVGLKIIIIVSETILVFRLILCRTVYNSKTGDITLFIHYNKLCIVFI